MNPRIYQTCCSCIGKNVAINTVNGRVYQGRISRVTKEHVYLESIARPVEGEQTKSILAKQADGVTNNEEKGTEIFFFAPIIPLAAIAGLTLIGTAPYYSRPYYRPYGPGFGYGPGFWW